MNDLTAESVEQMHYSQLVGLIRERNRPSGGIRSVHEVAVHAFLNSQSRVLEIGSNTGFTSVNLGLLTGCDVTGIDVNPPSVAEATAYARAQGVDARVRFQVANATGLPFEDEQFTLLWASNVTSFIDDKTSAIREYLRVLAFGGILAAVPIYYRKTPPANLVEQVGTAISSKLTVWSRTQWIELFLESARHAGIALELVYERDFEYLDRTDVLEAYCRQMVTRPHLANLPADVRAVIQTRYQAMMALFNTNLQYCGYSILLFQKRRAADELELFLTRPSV